MTDPRPNPCTKRLARRRTRGFTIVELLTSVFIIVVVMAIIFPVIGSLKNGSRIEAGLNTVSLASDVARAWSTASLPQVDRGSDPVNPVFGATYSGTAAIFCPTNEVRIVINNQGAFDGANSLEAAGVNGYWDYRRVNGGKRDLDYISIPQGSGVAGIHRFGNNTNAVHFLAPPFAITFDESGTLVQGTIYYDGDLDGNYDTGRNRLTVPGGYDPADWDRDSVAVDGTELVRPLPFEAIETIAGVVIYDEAAFKAAGFDFSGDGRIVAGTAGFDWLRENGEVVFFSPNTGTAMRDEGQE